MIPETVVLREKGREKNKITTERYRKNKRKKRYRVIQTERKEREREEEGGRRVETTEAENVAKKTEAKERWSI